MGRMAISARAVALVISHHPLTILWIAVAQVSMLAAFLAIHV